MSTWSSWWTCSLESTTTTSARTNVASSSSRRTGRVPSGDVIAVTCVPGSSQVPSKQGSTVAVAQVTTWQPRTASWGSGTATTRRPVRAVQCSANASRWAGVGL